MYDVYLDKILLPVAPGEIEMKTEGKNKTITLINNKDINILKSPNLREIIFEFLLPNVEYPFAKYPKGFKYASYYLKQLRELKKRQKPFSFKILRSLPGGKRYNTSLNVSLEDFTIIESTDEGSDFKVKIKLKQYKTYRSKFAKIIDPPESVPEPKPKPDPKPEPLPPPPSPEPMPYVFMPNRESSQRSPKPVKPINYTVVSGDCLWNIAKKHYGDGSKYPLIFEANKDKIANPNLIFPDQNLIIPPLQ